MVAGIAAVFPQEVAIGWDEEVLTYSELE